MTQAIALIARILLVFYYLKAGLTNMQKPATIEGMIKSKKLPQAKLIMMMVLALQIVGSVLIILNVYVVPAASALIVFTIAANALFCTYWTMDRGFVRSLTSFLFDANIAIIGGLLLLISFNM